MIKEVFGFNLKEYVVEFLRYMDTTVPEGVKSKKFIHLKYTNRIKTNKFITKYDFVDKTLLESVALHEFLSYNDEKKLFKINEFLEHNEPQYPNKISRRTQK